MGKRGGRKVRAKIRDLSTRRDRTTRVKGGVRVTDIKDGTSNATLTKVVRQP